MKNAWPISQVAFHASLRYFHRRIMGGSGCAWRKFCRSNGGWAQYCISCRLWFTHCFRRSLYKLGKICCIQVSIQFDLGNVGTLSYRLFSHYWPVQVILPSFVIHITFNIETYVRYIRVIEFWHLKPGFRHIRSCNAPEKCVFTNHVARLRLKENSIMRIESMCASL